MKAEYKAKLINRINRKVWWHCTPIDPQSYGKRGKFFSSTYREAEFYGRPNDEPERVTVTNPLIGDNDSIETALLGAPAARKPYAWRTAADEQFKIDAKLYEAGRKQGYDAIVLMSPVNYARFISEGRLPLSIELNLLKGDCQ
jgi:hypothetical protein